MLPLLLCLAFVPTDADGRPLPPGAVARLGSGRYQPGGWWIHARPLPDNRRVVLATWGGLSVLDLESGLPVWERSADDGFHPFHAAADAGRNELIACGTPGPTAEGPVEVRVFALGTGREAHRYRLDCASYRYATVSDDGRAVVWVAAGNALTAADARTGVVRWRAALPADAHPREGLAASAGTVAASFGGSVYTADLAAGHPTRAFPGNTGGLRFSPDGRTLTGIGTELPPDAANRWASFAWDVPGRRLLWVRTPPGDGWPGGPPAVSRDGRTAFVSDPDADGRPRLLPLRLADGTPAGPPILGAGLPAAERPDGRLVTAAGAVCVWDWQTGRRLAPDREPVPLGWHSRLHFSADGHRLTADPGGEPGGLLGWEVGTGREVERLTPAAAAAAGRAGGRHTAYSPGGRLRAVATPAAPRVPGQPLPGWTVAVTDARTGAEVARRTAPAGGVEFLRFTPDGRGLVFGRQMERYYFHDLTAGGPDRPFGEFDSGPGGSSGGSCLFAFDPAGRRAAVVTKNRTSYGNEPRCDFRVTVYDLPSLAVAAEFAGPGNVYTVGWSADGRWLGGAGTVAFVGAVPDGRFALRPRPFAVSWSGTCGVAADGRMLAVLDQTNKLRVLETITGRERLPGLKGWAAGFGPGDRLLATVDAGSTVLLYPLTAPADDGHPTDDWAALASDDAAAAFRAVRRLAADPARGRPLLRAHRPPALDPHPLWLAAQLARLNAPRFADRQAAANALRRVGRPAEPMLETAVRTGPPEARAAAARLLAELALDSPSAEDVRTVRAVEAVERMGTPAARELLRAWAAGTPDARLTREARAALTRDR